MDVEAETKQYPDPTTVLPDELVGGIFRMLYFSDRVAVSHVCSSWRRIALSDRRLWAEYRLYVQNSRDDAKAGVLSALLARSDPLPFCLVCPFSVSDAILELVIAHIGRMEELELGRFNSDDALQRILAQDILMLKRFMSGHRVRADRQVHVSTRWASAPRLEKLRLASPCIWPPTCTLGTLRSYSGPVPEGPGLHVPIAQIFPNVQVLDLLSVKQVSLPRLTPLPPFLASLKLITDDRIVGIDCSAVLQDRTASPLHTLVIDSTCSAPCVFDAIGLFEHNVDGPWGMFVYDGIVGSQAPISGTPAYHYSVVCLDPSLLSRLAEIAPFCGRLCKLDFRIDELLSLCASNVALPALVSISIVLTDRADSRLVNRLRNMPGIQTPVLQSLRLEVGFQFDRPIAGPLDRIVHAIHSPSLASILVDTHRPDALEHDEIAAFLARAARVEIRTSAGEAVYMFGQADTSDGSTVGEARTCTGRG